MQTFIAFFIALIASYIGGFIFRYLAIHLKIVDFPSKKKIHKNPIPLLGGLSIYLGSVLAFYFFPSSFKVIMPAFASATIILYMGVYDDIKGLSARLRLAIQLILASFVVYAGIRISFLPDNFVGNVFEYIITVIWIVGITNAYNYLDGLDGLATGSAAINLFCFLAVLYNMAQFPLGLAIAIMMGACLGFLPHNFTKGKRMFLGDAGSTFIGFMLACIAIQGDWASDGRVKLAIPVLILGVPIFDMIFTTIMRIKEEKVKNFVEWLKYGGKDHFHHYLVDLGLGTKGAVLFIYYITFSLGLSAFLVINNTALRGILHVVHASMIFGVIGVLIVLGKKRKKG